MSNDLNILSYLETGIRVEALKQQAIASNVANLNTPGYRRVDIKFEEILAEAMDKKKPANPSNMEFETYRPENTSVNANGNDVNLDKEVASMVKNNLRHLTFVRLLKKKYEMIDRAIKTTG